MGSANQSSQTKGSMNARMKTPDQNRAIFGAANAAGLDHDELRDLVADVTKRTRSIAALTYTEAEKVLARIKGKSFVPARTLQWRRKKAGVKQLVQQAQLDLIVELASQRNWPPSTLEGFCLKVCKRKKPLTTDEAAKVIEGLKAMNRREGLWAA
jgi:hypothetical protein